MMTASPPSVSVPDTPSGHGYRNAEIEVLRALAVLFVIIHHLVGLWVWEEKNLRFLAKGWWSGVDLFFAISGFVIARALLPVLEPLSGAAFRREVAAFWVRRAFRLWPLAWIWLFVPVLCAFIFNHSAAFGPREVNFPEMKYTLLQLANIYWYHCSQADLPYCGNFPMFWSLSLEEQFYLLFPFLIFFFRKSLPWALAVFVLLQFFLYRPHWHSFFAFIRTDAIMLGVLLAIFTRHRFYRALEPRLLLARCGHFAVPALALAMVAVARYAVVPFYMGLVALLGAVMVWLASYDRGYAFRDSVLRRALVPVGARSYAIYLTQMPACWFTREIWHRIVPAGTVFDWRFGIPFLLTAAFILVVLVEVSHRLIETPLRDYGRKIAGCITSRGG